MDEIINDFEAKVDAAVSRCHDRLDNLHIKTQARIGNVRMGVDHELMHHYIKLYGPFRALKLIECREYVKVYP